MNGINLQAVALVEDEEEFYPSSDGQPMAETGIHVFLMLNTLAMLTQHFRKQVDNICIIANMFLYYREGHPEARTAPDIMVIKGVDGRKRRRSFKTWVEKAVPCVVFEMTSKETAKEDQVTKRLLFEQLGIQEYFLFDPLHEYLPRQLLGYRLVKGKYRAMEPEEGGALVSRELGLRLIPEEANLALVDCRTGQRLLGMNEAYQSLEDARAKVEEAKEKTSQMENALEQERRKSAELAAQLKRLKGKKK